MDHEQSTTRSSFTSMQRRVSSFLGLGNESNAGYEASPWGVESQNEVEIEDLCPPLPRERRRDSPRPSSTVIDQNADQGPSSSASSSTSSSSSLKKKLSVFFTSLPPIIESTSPSSDENEIQLGSENRKSRSNSQMAFERVKKKMSIFFTNISTQMESPYSETVSGSGGSNAPPDQEDLFSYEGYKRNNRSQSDHTQGKRKGHRTRKLGAAMQSQHQLHLLTYLQLIGITFFSVSGGPFGFEPTVGAGGPGLMFVGLLFFPALWAAPLALMTAELSCMIPESGGHVLWVYRAFGPFWSFVNGCFAFACSLLDNALYPTLFVEYVSTLFYEGKHDIPYGWSVALKIFIVILVTVVNIIGIDIVGVASIVLGLMVLAPLALMCLIGLGHLNFGWLDSASNDSGDPDVIDWQKFVTLLLWNTSGFDAAGTCAAEVRNPGHSYPHALRVSLALIVGVYAVPTIIGISVIPNYMQWKEGTYMIVAKLIGGNFLKSWMGLSAASSALGLLLIRLCTNSRIVYGMALVEQVPPVFARLHQIYATPWVAILATSIWTLLLTWFNFNSLAEADMLFYAFSTILKFAALVQLRFTEPDAFRPYKIPMENYALAACAVIPVGLCISMIWLSSERAHGILLAGMMIAILCFVAKEFCNQYGSETEEAVNNRLSDIQENMNNMQKRIDRIIQEEFSAPLNNLGQAFRQNPLQRSGLGQEENQARDMNQTI